MGGAQPESGAKHPAEGDPEEFAYLVAVPESKEARELFELLVDARIPARISSSLCADDGRTVLNREPAAHATWYVFVPVRELPVAAEVAKRFLPWFGADEGEPLSEEEYLAALDEPSHVERGPADARMSMMAKLILAIVAVFGVAVLFKAMT